MERAGLFGGTFNPVHMGHLRVAEEVRDGFGLDRIYFIPAANPPHKQQTGIAPAEDRCEMLRLATAGNPSFKVSDAEIRRQGRSYTIDTVKQITADLPDQAECFLILGIDAFLEIDTWKSYQTLFEQIPFIVISRPAGLDGKDPFAGFPNLIARKISDNYQFDPENRRYVHPQKHAIYVFEVTALDIAATRIRSMVAEGVSIRYLVPEAVSAYINEKRLYL